MLLEAYFVLWAKNAAGRTLFSHSLWSIFRISYFDPFKMQYYSPWSFLFSFFTMLWPALTCEPASWCGDCLLPAVSAASKAPLLLLRGQRSKNTWQEWVGIWQMEVKKKKPRWILRSSLWWRWWWGGVLQDSADQVSSVTSIIMRAVLWSGFGEASLLSVRSGFLQMGVRLLRGASLPGFWCSRFKTLTPSNRPPPHKRSPLTCHVEGSRWGSSWHQTLTSLVLLPQRIWGGVGKGGAITWPSQRVRSVICDGQRSSGMAWI